MLNYTFESHESSKHSLLGGINVNLQMTAIGVAAVFPALSTRVVDAQNDDALRETAREAQDPLDDVKAMTLEKLLVSSLERQKEPYQFSGNGRPDWHTCGTLAWQSIDRH